MAKTTKSEVIKLLPWAGVAVVYALTLVTQLPHIYAVYSALESEQYAIFGFNTALGAAIAFEATVAILTLRLIVNTKSERSPWTRAAVVTFLVISAIANFSYYFTARWLDDYAMPVILAVALPLALWVYAEEFGKGARAEAKRRAKPATVTAEPPKRTATITDWREICATTNGDLRDITADDVPAMLAERNLAPPTPRTMQNWVKGMQDGGGD